MGDDAAKVEHGPVEGPEETLDPVRDESHEETGLKAKAMQLEAREKELVDRLQRLGADFENHRRRAREDGAASSARGKEALLRALIPVLDNLDRALAHATDEGLRLLARQFQANLETQGVRIIAPEGEAFDARYHEAIAQEAREGTKSGTVLVVLERGYELDGRVLRPARVVVAA